MGMPTAERRTACMSEGLLFKGIFQGDANREQRSK